MGFPFSSSTILIVCSVFGFSLILSQDLRERDAFCNGEGCFVVYFESKTFLDSWRSCKEKGGNLATIKRKEEANNIATLFSTLDLRDSRTTVRVWIGLQRQPRQCSSHPLRGFSWTTGDQDTEYTNWHREDSPSMCPVPRCVAMIYSTQEHSDNFGWIDDSCYDPADGYLCHYVFKGMCSPLWTGGSGNILYITPFNLLSTILTHVPVGSTANISCQTNTKESQQVFCLLGKSGLAAWSLEPPFCSFPSILHQTCEQDNGGCEHFCRLVSGQISCECAEGFRLRYDGQTCEHDFCQGDPCEFECLTLPDGYNCACPDGYMLAPDEHKCLDVDECLQAPCEQLCENLLGTFECQCFEGYLLNENGICEDIDECLNDSCDQSCKNAPGSYICSCNLGYSVDSEKPTRCKDTDECQIAGTCEQMCVNHVGGFECFCKEGYELSSDQSTCNKIKESQSVTPAFPPVPDSELEYKDYEMDATTTTPFLSTSTVSEGAWNWWPGLSTSTQSLENPIVKHYDSDIKKETEQEKHSPLDYPQFPGQESGKEGKNYADIMDSQSTAVPTEFRTPTQLPPFQGGGGGDDLDSVQKDREHKQSNMGLLVGLSVSICILIVLMVALSIFYCTYCGVKPRNKNATECYHWISGAHNKQDAPSPSTRDKTLV